VVVYPSGRWADWIVAASSGVSTDPTWAAHLRASVRHTDARCDTGNPSPKGAWSAQDHASSQRV